MSAHAPAEIAAEERRYLVVFGWLFVFTALEVAIIYVPIHKYVIAGMLVVLAATKAALVALYYMHLVHEKRTLTYIALTPALLCVFLLFMLMPDLGRVTRAITHAVAQATGTGAHPAAH
jgi:cytochrome c oxidase subunit 4